MIVLSMAQTFANPASAARLAEKSRLVGAEDVFDELLQIGSVSGSVVVKKEANVAEAQAMPGAAMTPSTYAVATVRTEASHAPVKEVIVQGNIVEVISQSAHAEPQMSSVDMFEASLKQPQMQSTSDATAAVLSQLVSQAKESQLEVVAISEVKEVVEPVTTQVVETGEAVLINMSPAPLTASSIQTLLHF